MPADGSELIGQWVPVHAQGMQLAIVTPLQRLATQAFTLATVAIVPLDAAAVIPHLQAVSSHPLLHPAFLHQQRPPTHPPPTPAAPAVPISAAVAAPALADAAHEVELLVGAISAAAQGAPKWVQKRAAGLQEGLDAVLVRLAKASRQAEGGNSGGGGSGSVAFEWVDSPLVTAIRNGDWVSRGGRGGGSAVGGRLLGLLPLQGGP